MTNKPKPPYPSRNTLPMMRQLSESEFSEWEVFQNQAILFIL